MKAILFSPNNIELILAEVGVSPDAAPRVFSRTPSSQEYAFIPEYVSSDGLPYGWVMLEMSWLKENYAFDALSIGHKFVHLIPR